MYVENWKRVVKHLDCYSPARCEGIEIPVVLRGYLGGVWDSDPAGLQEFTAPVTLQRAFANSESGAGEAVDRVATGKSMAPVMLCVYEFAVGECVTQRYHSILNSITFLVRF